MPKGTAKITARGRPQRSYWAAKIRNTTKIPSISAMVEELPLMVSW